MADSTEHRGALGEYGTTGGGFVERTFRERIITVGVVVPPVREDQVRSSLDELDRLVDTAGADVVDRVIARRDRPDPGLYLGKGKVEEIYDLAEMYDCDTVVFDAELTPAQQFNLEKILKRTAIGRTEVILDIFAQNAHSIEGKTQVELAQLRYRLPRLRGKGGSLSQQAGRIGTRGPGETQLEVDRRRIERRIHKLERDLRTIDRVRATQRKSRRRHDMATVAIVGYTNAGKSTLMNRLTDAGVLVEDRLFATLDDTTRRLELPGSGSVLVADTVGFISNLPHMLVEAFKSTLEVAAQSDLLIHMVDAGAPDPEHDIAAVHEVLAEIGAAGVPQLVVFNKSDRVPPQTIERLRRRHPHAVIVSSLTGAGVDELMVAVEDRVRPVTEIVRVDVPHDRGDVVAALHRAGEVLDVDHHGDGTRLRVRVPQDRVAQFEAWMARGGP